jgi:excisionase family DNA binding protein
MMSPEYLTLKELAAYASVCVNTLKKWKGCGMPYFEVGGVLRIKRSEFDAWMRQFRSGTESTDLEAVWNQVMEEVTC